MRKHFKRPTSAMGEAWFIGDERYQFEYLFDDIDRELACRCMRPLEEIPSGPINFGALDEWTNWYNYLLAALFP